MKRILLIAVAAWTGATTQARACGYGGLRPLEQFVSAKTVLAGKILRYEDEPVRLKMSPQQAEGQDFSVAVVQVRESLKGADGLTHVRIAVWHRWMQQLQPGQEHLFFLNPHFKESILIPTSARASQRIRYEEWAKDKNNLYRRFARMRGDISDHLIKGTDAERITALALLMSEHNVLGHRQPSENHRREYLSEELSRRMMRVLIEVDWSELQYESLGWTTTPANLFLSRVRPMPEHGWHPKEGMSFDQLQEAAKEWCRANVENVRFFKLTELR